MFQPTNPSYIDMTVRSTMDQHMGESEEERAIRDAKSYDPHPLASSYAATRAIGIAMALVFAIAAFIALPGPPLAVIPVTGSGAMPIGSSVTERYIVLKDRQLDQRDVVSIQINVSAHMAYQPTQPETAQTDRGSVLPRAKMSYAELKDAQLNRLE